MTEQPKELSTAELLQRIVQLENQAARFGQRQADIEDLKAKIADLGKAFKAEVANVTAEFQHIHRYIADIHDQLWPLMHKVFPGSVKTQNQIAQVIRNSGRSWNEKDRPPSS